MFLFLVLFVCGVWRKAGGGSPVTLYQPHSVSMVDLLRGILLSGIVSRESMKRFVTLQRQ